MEKTTANKAMSGSNGRERMHFKAMLNLKGEFINLRIKRKPGRIIGSSPGSERFKALSLINKLNK